nr:MAG TPA: Protein of unknown function (DUF4044) [Caudoviricetes sp.]
MQQDYKLKTTNIMMEIMIILWLIGVIFGASQGRK